MFQCRACQSVYPIKMDKCMRCGGKLEEVKEATYNPYLSRIHTHSQEEGLMQQEDEREETDLSDIDDDDEQSGLEDYPPYNEWTSRQVGDSRKKSGCLVGCLVGGLIIIGILLLGLMGSSEFIKKVKAYTQEGETVPVVLEGGEGNIRSNKGSPDEVLQCEEFKGILSQALKQETANLTWEDIDTVTTLALDKVYEGEWYETEKAYTVLVCGIEGQEEPKTYSVTEAFANSFIESRDIQYFKGLNSLKLLGSGVDLEDLKGLNGLEVLALYRPSGLGENIEALAGFEQLKELTLESDTLTSLQGVGELTELESLRLMGTSITDYSPLLTLSQLKSLAIDSKLPVNMQQIAELATLQKLVLTGDNVVDITPAEKLMNLQSMTLEDTSILSIESLAKCSGLKEVTLVDNENVKDLTPLEGCKALESLTLDQTDGQLPKLGTLKTLSIQAWGDISGIGDMPLLETIEIRGEHLSGIESLKGHEHLKKVVLDQSERGSLGISEDCSFLFKLPAIEVISLKGGPIDLEQLGVIGTSKVHTLELDGVNLVSGWQEESDGFITAIDYDRYSTQQILEQVTKMNQLKALTVKDMELTQLDFLKTSTALTYLDVSQNQILDLEPLRKLSQLEELAVNDNLVQDLAPLLEIPSLKKVNLRNLKLVDLSQVEKLTINVMK